MICIVFVIFMRHKEKAFYLMSSVLCWWGGGILIWSHIILTSAMWREVVLTDSHRWESRSSVAVLHFQSHITCEQWSKYLSLCPSDLAQFFSDLSHSQIQTILVENHNICWFLSFLKLYYSADKIRNIAGSWKMRLCFNRLCLSYGEDKKDKEKQSL